VKTESLAKEAAALEKWQISLSDVQSLKDENRRLSQIIGNMKLERNSMERGRQDLTRRSESLQRDLDKAHRDYREMLTQTERLKEESSLVLQKLNDANERRRKDFQIIRDLEDEIRLKTNGRSQADLSLVNPRSGASNNHLRRWSDHVGSSWLSVRQHRTASLRPSGWHHAQPTTRTGHSDGGETSP